MSYQQSWDPQNQQGPQYGISQQGYTASQPAYGYDEGQYQSQTSGNNMNQAAAQASYGYQGNYPQAQSPAQQQYGTQGAAAYTAQPATMQDSLRTSSSGQANSSLGAPPPANGLYTSPPLGYPPAPFRKKGGRPSRNSFGQAAPVLNSNSSDNYTYSQASPVAAVQYTGPQQYAGQVGYPSSPQQGYGGNMQQQYGGQYQGQQQAYDPQGAAAYGGQQHYAGY